MLKSDRTARLITHRVGLPPIAAISLKLTVSAFAPSIAGVPQSSLKWTPSTIESIVISDGFDDAAKIAQSSPGPRTNRPDCGKRAHRRAINSNSPGGSFTLAAWRGVETGADLADAPTSLCGKAGCLPLVLPSSGTAEMAGGR